MLNNTSLNQAQKKENDEFYTQYEDIEKELCNYKHIEDFWLGENCKERIFAIRRK